MQKIQQTGGQVKLGSRPGVIEIITNAKAKGMKLALVTTTSSANVAALLRTLSDQIGSGDFDLILDPSVGTVVNPQPVL